MPNDKSVNTSPYLPSPRPVESWFQICQRSLRVNIVEPLNWIVWVGIILYGMMSIVPLFLAFYFSLTNYNLLYPASDFIGLENYLELISDAGFIGSLKVTLIVSISVTLAVNVLSLLVALMLNHKGKFYTLLRTLFFIPQVLSAVIVSFIWKIILTDRGLLNTVMQQLGLMTSPTHWLGLPNLAIFSVILVVTWQLLGFSSVIYLASLQGIPQDMLEAASIDGASRWKQFWYITWPLIAPGMTINMVLILIIVFKLYDQVAVLTGGGPGGATETLSYYIVRVGFVANRTGYASSLAVVLFLVITILSSISVKYLKQREVELT